MSIEMPASQSDRPKPKLFLSYSHADGQLASRLARDLSIKGVEVWIDDTEIKVGDLIPAKIREAIAAADFFAVILSPQALKSKWVLEEIRYALDLLRTAKHPTILPIRLEACASPPGLEDFVHVDFLESFLYRRSLTTLLHAIHGKPRHTYLTAKEAARKVHVTQRPPDGLCGLSQTGTTQQYISTKTMQEGDWVSADVKTGRSAVWIVDYYNRSDCTLHSYGVFDGEVTAFPVLHMQGPDEPRLLDFNFADSDVVVPTAITRAQSYGAIPNEKDYFVLSRLRYYNQPGYIWHIMFLDESFTNTTYVVSVDPLSGKILASGPPAERNHTGRERHTVKSQTWGDPLQKLRHDLQGVEGVVVNFSSAARELFADKKRRGFFDGIDVEVALELVSDYEERLETITQRRILDELEKLGKLDEFERVLASDIDPNAYLNHVIPDFRQFLQHALESAKARI